MRAKRSAFPLPLFIVPGMIIVILTLCFGDRCEKKIVFIALAIAVYLLLRYFSWMSLYPKPN
jgi:hypothetical protein